MKRLLAGWFCARWVHLGALVMVMVACATTATGRKQLLLLPEDELSSVGRQAFQEMLHNEPVSDDPRVNRYVRCVTRELLSGVNADEGRWQVAVFDSKQANAFALPGGKIGVFTGMLKVARTQDQLAAVVAHEIAHVTEQHGNERVSQALVAEGGLAAASAALGGDGTERDAVLAALGIGAQVGVLMPFARTQETEADILGLEYMAQAGFDPRAAVTLWQNMESAAGASPPQFLSTHPSHGTRIDNLTDRMPRALELYRDAVAQGRSPRCSLAR